MGEFGGLENRYAEGWWCIRGDFNSIRNKKERIGRNNVTRTTDMNDFNEFIEVMELVNVPSLGERFTWAN